MSTAVEKAEALHLSGIGVDAVGVTEVDGYESYGLVKSRFDELSIPRTVWVFRRVVLIVLAVYTGYVCEGFEVCKCKRQWSWLLQWKIMGLMRSSLELGEVSLRMLASSSSLAMVVQA